MEQKKRKAKLLLWLSIVVAIVVASVLLFKFLISPSIKYSSAEKILRDGNYVDAISAFSELGNFRDSKGKITAAKEGIYNDALDSLSTANMTKRLHLLSF